MASRKDSSEKKVQCPGDNCRLDLHICRGRQMRDYPPCKQCDFGLSFAKSRSVEPSKQDQLAAVLYEQRELVLVVLQELEIGLADPGERNPQSLIRIGFLEIVYLETEPVTEQLEILV